MAAEQLLAGGARVHLFDAMPTVGRKFLMAGKGGLNITHAEPQETILTRYGARSKALESMLNAFGATPLRDWVHGLGVETFVGTSQRVFPKEMKAAPLLRAWLHRLRAAGLRIHARHRWTGWNSDGALRFATPQGFNTGEHFFQYLKDSFDCLYEEGRRGSPKMMSVGLHCRLAGRPGRALGLAKFIDYVLSHDKVWIPRRIDIARHWHKTFGLL